MDETIKLFNGELEISKASSPNMYQATVDMGEYEMECYLSDTAQCIFSSPEYLTMELIKKVVDLIEQEKITSDDSQSFLPVS